MPWLIAVARAPGMETLTTSEPEAFRNSRRVMGFMVVSSGCQRAGGALDRAQDRHVRAAAALDAGHGLAYLGVTRFRVGLEERRRGHDPARGAVTALQHLLGD